VTAERILSALAGVTLVALGLDLLYVLAVLLLGR
jgi:hypothetical protein